MRPDVEFLACFTHGTHVERLARYLMTPRHRKWGQNRIFSLVTTGGMEDTSLSTNVEKSCCRIDIADAIGGGSLGLSEYFPSGKHGKQPLPKPREHRISASVLGFLPSQAYEFPLENEKPPAKQGVEWAIQDSNL